MTASDSAPFRKALEAIEELGNTCLMRPSMGYDYDQAYREGSHNAFSQAAEIAREALSQHPAATAETDEAVVRRAALEEAEAICRAEEAAYEKLIDADEREAAKPRPNALASDRIFTQRVQARSTANALANAIHALIAAMPSAPPWRDIKDGTLHARDEWHEDVGDVLWWRFPIDEAPFCGTPLDRGWPGYHTHWTRFTIPSPPSNEAR